MDLRSGAMVLDVAGIGLANWTPAGFVGEVFKALGKHVLTDWTQLALANRGLDHAGIRTAGTRVPSDCAQIVHMATRFTFNQE